MQKLSSKSLIAIASSVLLPYGTVTANTWIFTTNQYWLFPLWTYVHDFGNWLGFGMVIPIFLPSFPYLTSILGLIWLMLGLYISRALNQLCFGQREAHSVRTLTQFVLLVQIIGTVVVSFIVWIGMIVIVIPLPLQPLVVFYLYRREVQDQVLEPFDN